MVSLGSASPVSSKWNEVSSCPESRSSWEPERRPGPAAGPSASIAILELQKIVALGNFNSALHRFGSFLPAGVWSKASKAALFFAPVFVALLQGMPLHWPAEESGG